MNNTEITLIKQTQENQNCLLIEIAKAVGVDKKWVNEFIQTQQNIIDAQIRYLESSK